MTRKRTARGLAKHIPAELLAQDRWITWSEVKTRSGKKTKKPDGSVSDPNNSYTFEQVEDTVCDATRGIGFRTTDGVFIDGYRVLAFDMDACRDPVTGELSGWADEVLDHYGRGFCEVTPSGSGIRPILLVKNPPESLPIINIPTTAPDGVTKNPEIQIFGFGSAQYFTVSGNRLKGTTLEIPRVDDMDWMQERFGVDEIEQLGKLELPVGKGRAPSAESIRKKVGKHQDGAHLIDGHWEELGLESASEAWWRLSRTVLKAANNHGKAAVDFLLDHTGFGTGDIDSKDPERYRRRSWVERDLCRIAGKTREQGAQAFSDGFDIEQWKPPEPRPRTKRILQAADFDSSCGTTKMLVYDALPAQGIAQFFGDPSSGKTPFAMSLAMHVVLGLDWFGHEMERPGAVVYMIGEDATGIRDRMRAQLQALDPTANLSDIPFYATQEPGRLIEQADAKAWVEEIIEICKDEPRVSLIVVDTQNRNFGPGNENSTEDMTLFVDSLELIRRKLKCCVLLVHHSGLSDKDRARGSSVLFGSLDAQFEIRRDGEHVMAVCHKAKNWAEPKALRGSLVVENIGTDHKGRPQTAITLSDKPPAPSRTAFVDTMDAELNVLAQAIRMLPEGERVSQQQLSIAAGLTRKKVRVKLKTLVESGLVEVDTNTKGTLYTFTDWGMANLFPDNNEEEDLFS